MLVVNDASGFAGVSTAKANDSRLLCLLQIQFSFNL